MFCMTTLNALKLLPTGSTKNVELLMVQVPEVAAHAVILLTVKSIGGETTNFVLILSKVL